MNKIIHRIAVCCLILVMSFKLFGGFAFNLYFWWNQKQLAKAYCENQNRPKMKCNGKCYLAKQLAKIENDYQKKQRQPAPFQLKSAEWIYVQPEDVRANIVLALAEERKYAVFRKHFSSDHISTVPSPPPQLL